MSEFDRFFTKSVIVGGLSITDNRQKYAIISHLLFYSQIYNLLTSKYTNDSRVRITHQ